MSAKGLHKIMGARYQHNKPALCPFCIERSDYGRWAGYCHARNKILSEAKEGVNYDRQRCSDYKDAGPKD